CDAPEPGSGSLTGLRSPCNGFPKTYRVRRVEPQGGRMRRVFLASACVLLALAGGSPARPAVGDATVIFGARLLTVTRGEIPSGSILIMNGKIKEIGEKIDPPPGAEVILAQGMVAMPGIVDTHSHLGVYSWPEVDANSDGNEMTDPVQAGVRAMDSVNLGGPRMHAALA